MAPEQTLIEKVAVPEYFAKVAADTGISPHDAQAAYDLRVLGDRVSLGVERFIAKRAAAEQTLADDLIKVAAASAAAAAGLFPAPPAPVPTDPTKVAAADVEAYEAALAVLAKQAAAAPPPAAAPAVEDDEDDEEAVKKKTPTPAAAGVPA